MRMPRARLVQPSRGPASVALAALLSAFLALVVCGRSLGRGLYLYRDFVTVPDPVLNAAAWGGSGQGPRAVPLDAVTAILAPVVPPGAQQQLMLVSTVFLAALGTAVALRRHGLAAMCTGATVAAWNPFVAERLLLGQPPTLLAYSMTPWIVAAVRSDLRGARSVAAITLAALPAALTPWGGLSAAATALGTAALTPVRRSPGWLAACGGAAVAWCLPWLVPALLTHQGGAGGNGAVAFAVRSDSPLGRVGSVLTLGGIWARGAPPASRESGAAVIASLAVFGLAAAGLAVTVRAGRTLSAVGLGLAWLVPPLLALAVSGGPGLHVFSALQSVPGVAVGRDTHRWLAPAALATAVLAGLAVEGVQQWVRRPNAHPGVAVAPVAAAAVVASSLAVLAVPDLPAGVRAAYRPGDLPSDWAPMVAATDRAAGAGAVLSMPWLSFRQTAWNGTDRPFLDPLPLALQQEVVRSRELTVVRGGRVVVVDADTAAIAADLRRGVLDPAALSRSGITAVVQWRGTPGATVVPDPALRQVFSGPHFVVWAVTGAN